MEKIFEVFRMKFLRWFVVNLGTLLLAFSLALVVWVTAVVSADPNEEVKFRPVSIDRVGQSADLLLVGEMPSQVRLTLRAPRSIWEKLNNDPSLVHAWVDLSGLNAGEHTLPIKVRVDASPIRLLEAEPKEVKLRLEPLVSQELPIQLVVEGDLPLGYKKGSPLLDPVQAVVSGPESMVSQVVQVRASLDIVGNVETFREFVSIEAVDESGSIVSGVLVTPKRVEVMQPISLLGGFKNVVVRVLTKGQVVNGYRLTNISVSPPTVTVFSDDPHLIAALPGYVDTLPVDLANLTDDIEINVGLNLEEGITLVREPSVLVQVSVAAIEGSMTLTLPVEVIGLSPEVSASIAPATVDVIIAGPLNILDVLNPASFRVVLDLTGLPPGVYQRSPIVDLFPDQVRIQTTLPETVEVTITESSTPTPVQTQETTATPTP